MTTLASLKEKTSRARLTRLVFYIPILEESDITFKRPGGGLDPRYADRYLGQKAKIPVLTDELITEAMLDKQMVTKATTKVRAILGNKT